MQPLNDHEIPPGGWQFFQPQTGWSAPSPVSFTLDDQTVNLIKHRQANPAITSKHKLATDFQTVKAEIMAFNEKRLGIPSLPKSHPVSSPQPGPGVAGGSAIRKLAAGAALLFDWEESGLPPEAGEVSESRAKTCSICRKNSSNPLTDFFTVPVAESIKRRLSRLHGMNLATSVDAKLGTCEVCLCPLRLKVHTPKELILKRLKPGERAELNQSNPRCWILDLA